MTELTQAHWTILNTRGGNALVDARNAGELPDCVEVNARIAERFFNENPANYSFGKWFFADYINGQYRRGRVSVQKMVMPNESVRYIVVAPGGRWTDTLTEQEAIKHLRSIRINGSVLYLSDEQIKNAENDRSWALSR